MKSIIGLVRANSGEYRGVGRYPSVNWVTGTLQWCVFKTGHSYYPFNELWKQL